MSTGPVARIAVLLVVVCLSACGPYGRGWGDATALHKAAWRGDLEAMEQELSGGTDVNVIATIAMDKGGWAESTPADIAAWATIAQKRQQNLQALRWLRDRGGRVKESTATSAIVWTTNVELLAVMLDGMIEADPVLEDGSRSPYLLQVAADQSDTARLELLLARGAQVTLTTADGQTALHHASRYGTLAAIEVLVHAGAEVDARDSFGLTPLHYAAERRDSAVASKLIASGASVNAIGRAKDEPRGIRPHNYNDGCTPLMVAAERGTPEMIELLLAAGADRTLRDERGYTAAEIADRRWVIPGQEGRVARVRELLTRGAGE